MQTLPVAQLDRGRGIVGDRYYKGIGTFSDKLRGKPDFEVTLIESEEIDTFNHANKLSLDHGALRRNLVTQGVRLNALVGVRFRVGEVVLEGIRLCEPCAHLAATVAPQVLPVLMHRAGLRAAIVVGGAIRPGDRLAHAS
jgi:MOSC domain-containing protein YiiM